LLSRVNRLLSKYLNLPGAYAALSNHQKLYTPVQGKTYSLFAEGNDSERYYTEIKHLTDVFLQRCPDEKRLLSLIQQVGKRPFLSGLKTKGADRKMLQFVRETLRQSLSIYTRNVASHLKSLPLEKRLDETLATPEEKYHLYMLEIELVNRIYKEEFQGAEYKFALIAHCLRDFRPECRSEAGDIEAVCPGCTERGLLHSPGKCPSGEIRHQTLYICRNGSGEPL
jgi:hypothetical protein